MRSDARSVPMTAAQSGQTNIFPYLAAMALILAMVVLAGQAHAQFAFPRIGFSAQADAYVDTLNISPGETFDLHVLALGQDEGQPLGYALLGISWIVYQVCCGASLEVANVVYNDAYTHTGDPLFGVESDLNGCTEEDFLYLATITATLNAPQNGEYVMAAGPFLNAVDCLGESPPFMDMPIRIRVGGNGVSNDETSWGSLKAIYR